MYHRHFEHIASRQPSSVALVEYRHPQGPSQLSFGELNSLSNRLARAVKTHLPSLVPQYIGVCLGVLDEQLPIFLASLKLGCAFVPMEPFHPAERNVQMMKQTKAFCVVTRREYDVFTQRLEDLPGLKVKKLKTILTS
jgi:non-ribosomal peptide synthetase component F